MKLKLLLSVFFAACSMGLALGSALPPNIAPSQITAQCGIYNLVTQGGCDPTNTLDSTAAMNQGISTALNAGLAPYLPTGQYKISGPVFCFRWAGVTIQQFESFNFYAGGSFGSNQNNGGSNSTINFTNGNTFCFATDANYNCNFYNLTFNGPTTTGFIGEGSAALANGAASWIGSGIRGWSGALGGGANSYNADFVIDPATSTSLPPDGGYTDAGTTVIYSWTNSGGSHNIQFWNCNFNNAAVGLGIQPQGNSVNGDMIILHGGGSLRCGIVVANGDSQSDGDAWYDANVSQEYIGYDNSLTGNLDGQGMWFTGGQWTGHKYLYNFAGNTGNLIYNNIFIEGCYALGIGASGIDSVSYRDCIINFGALNSTPAADFIGNTNGTVNFYNCYPTYAGHSSNCPIRWRLANSGSVHVYGDNLPILGTNHEALGNFTQVASVYQSPGGWFFPEGCMLGDQNSPADWFSTVSTNPSQTAFPNYKKMLPGESFLNMTDGKTYTNTASPEWTMVSNYPVTIDSTTNGTGHFVPSAAAFATIRTGVLFRSNNQNAVTEGGDQAAFNAEPIVGNCIGVSVSSGTVTIGNISQSLVGAASLSVRWVEHCAVAHAPSTVTSTSGSVTVNNLGGTNAVWGANDYCTMPGAFPNGTYIVSNTGGTTYVMSAAATATVNTIAYDADLVGQGNKAFAGWTFSSGTVTASGTTPVTVITYLPSSLILTLTDSANAAVTTSYTVSKSQGQFIFTGSAGNTDTYRWDYTLF